MYSPFDNYEFSSYKMQHIIKNNFSLKQSAFQQALEQTLLSNIKIQDIIMMLQLSTHVCNDQNDNKKKLQTKCKMDQD